MSGALDGSRVLVVGIANDRSIAYGCARAMRAHGAELALTYLNDKARPHVQPLADELGARLLLPLDVTVPEQLEAVFAEVERTWGGLDAVVHAIAFAPKDDLQGGLLQCSAAGFAHAMDVSCHSFIRMARLAVPLMAAGGTLLTLTFLGAERVVANYDVMGPVKAALEASVRYLAVDLGPKRVRVHALSPGPMHTRAATGIRDFGQMWADYSGAAPLGPPVDVDDVGETAAWLVSPQAARLTGNLIYVDGGRHLLA